MESQVREFILSEFDRLKDKKTKQRNKIIIEAVRREFDEIIDADDIYEICVRIRNIKEKIKSINDDTDTKK